MEWIFGIALVGTIAYAVSTRQKFDRYLRQFGADSTWNCQIDVTAAIADHPKLKEVTGVKSIRTNKMTTVEKKNWNSKWSQQFSSGAYLNISYLPALGEYAVFTYRDGNSALRYLAPRGTMNVYQDVVLGTNEPLRGNRLELVVGQKYISGVAFLEISIVHVDSDLNRTSTILGVIPATHEVTNEYMESLGYEVETNDDYPHDGVEYSMNGLTVRVR